VLNKSDREGVDHLETQLQAMLELAPERDGWKPKIVRTVATENKGIDELAAAIAEYRQHFDRASGRQTKKVEHWKRRLVTLAQELFTEHVVAGPQGEGALDALAREVADRRKDPYSAVYELLARAGLSWNAQTKIGTNE
jgi:LAO/AO transport system kinase